MDRTTTFLGRPIEYWMSLKALVATMGIDKHIEKIVQLEERVRELEETLGKIGGYKNEFGSFTGGDAYDMQAIARKALRDGQESGVASNDEA